MGLYLGLISTGATLDKMVYENQMLVASVTPNGGTWRIVYSNCLPVSFLQISNTVNPDNENQFDTPFVMIIGGQEYPLDEGVKLTWDRLP